MPKRVLKILLKEFVLTQKGVKPILLKKEPFEESVPYLDINALETGEFKEFTFKELGTLSSEKDVLVVWDGSRSGLAFRGSYGVIGSTLMKLTPICLTTEYLLSFLKSNYSFINRNTTGGGIPHVDADLLFSLKVPYVPLKAQVIIIDKLNKRLFNKSSMQKKHSETINRALSEIGVPYDDSGDFYHSIKQFRQAVLQFAISGVLTASWRKKGEYRTEPFHLGSLIKEIKSGKSFRCLERPPNTGEIGVIKISAVSSYNYLESESKTCIDRSKINSELFIKTGDFLISRANTRELVGSCVIVNTVKKKIMLSDKIWRVKFDNTKISTRFAYYFLRSKDGRNQIENFAAGSQESMKNITQEDLKEIKLKIPDLKEQHEIVKKIDALLKIADRIESQFNKASDDFMKLEQSLYNQTFSDSSLKQYSHSVNSDDVLEQIKSERLKLEKERKEFNKSSITIRKSMKQKIIEISTLDIEDVLMKNSKPMTAREVWKASKYSNDIDSFYEALKNKSNRIGWEITKKNTAAPESLLFLKEKTK